MTQILPPKPIPHMTFGDLNISPRDTKRLDRIYGEAKDISKVIKNKGTKRDISKQINSTSLDTRLLLGLDTGYTLNNRIKEPNFRPYTDVNAYDTENHKHLPAKVVKKRCDDLGKQSPAAIMKYHNAPHHKHVLIHKLNDNQFAQIYTKAHRADNNYNKKAAQQTHRHIHRNYHKIIPHEPATHHKSHFNGPEM